MANWFRMLAYFLAPTRMARHDLIVALEVSAARKIVSDRPLNRVEKAIVVAALQRIRVDRPGVERRMENALKALAEKRESA